MFKNKLIRFLFFITLCILFTGCSVKQPATESKPPETTTQPPESEDTDDFDLEDSYLHGGSFGDSIEISNEYVKLDYFIALSRKEIDCTVLAFQNGAAVPFSFEPDGDYSLSHRKTFPTREQNGSIYIKAADFHQGDSVSFGMGFVCNSDFMPEIQESPHYGREQMINHYAKAYTASRDFSSDTVINILTDVDWESYPDILPSRLAASINEHDDLEALKDLMHGKLINNFKVMDASGKDSIRIYYLLEQNPEVSFPAGAVSFYLDHLPLKINGKYDAVYITPPEKGFLLAGFDLSLPEDLESGPHTFYSRLVSDNPDITYHYTDQRILLY